MPLLRELIEQARPALDADFIERVSTLDVELADPDGGPRMSIADRQRTVDELKDIFTDCDQVKGLFIALGDLGLLGCGRWRRIKAVAAAIGVTQRQIKDCIQKTEDELEQEEPGLIVLPPFEMDIPDELFPGACADTYDPLLCPPQEPETGGLCAMPTSFLTPPGAEPTPDDLPDTPDCEEARDILQMIQDLIPGSTETSREPGKQRIGFQEEDEPPPPQAIPTISPTTLLDLAWKTYAIFTSPAFDECEKVKDDALDNFKTMSQFLAGQPVGWLNTDLLPFPFKPGSRPDVLPEKRRISTLSPDASSAATARRASHRRHTRNQQEA